MSVNPREAAAFGHHRRAQPAQFRVGSSMVVLRDSTAVIDDVIVDLSPREHDVVARLLRRPGAVVPKGELLDDVWRGEADAHVVEATINRLRRRLTETSIRVETVPKRGYRLVPTR